MPLDKKVKLASFQENMLSHETEVQVSAEVCAKINYLKLVVPATRLFFSCGVFGHTTRHWRLQELFL